LEESDLIRSDCAPVEPHFSTFAEGEKSAAAKELGTQPCVRWSSARLFGFRFVFAITALSSLRLAGYITAFLLLETLIRTANRVFNGWSGLQFRITMSIGAFVIRERRPASVPID
jgi:hypothetical protein